MQMASIQTYFGGPVFPVPTYYMHLAKSLESIIEIGSDIDTKAIADYAVFSPVLEGVDLPKCWNNSCADRKTMSS
jgi:hypothetical protein